MQHLKTKLLSALLALLTVLSLLPTGALAANSTGTGIMDPGEAEFNISRVNSHGSTYYYSPPKAAGKRLFCCDLGYSYLSGSAAFMNSYTYKSADGADADAVLAEAVANSGLGEMDAMTLENVKWMMSFAADYTGDVRGAIFMAVQTYIWDHQTDKRAGGDTTGEIDAGGFANAGTYEAYLGHCNWMLSLKAQEDAELQQQVADYAAQGVQASIVEDSASKWAVFAKSSVSGRQSFFAYHSKRIVRADDTPSPGVPVEPETPPAGDSEIVFRKLIAGTTQGLDGAVYNIYRDGQIIGSEVTSGGGYIRLSERLTTGLYTFAERTAPAGYALDPAPHSVYVDVTDGQKEYTITAEDAELPGMKIVKTDALTGEAVQGAVFSIHSVTGDFSTSVTTGADGTASLDELDCGVYEVREASVPAPYIVCGTAQIVALRPGKVSEVSFQNYTEPGLEILKKNTADGSPIGGVTFSIEQIDGTFSASATTDEIGRIFLENIPAGSYKITETAAPDNVIFSGETQTVELEPGRTVSLTFYNSMKPSLRIVKTDADTGEAVPGTVFLVKAADGGSINEVKTGQDGSGVLENLLPGVYEVSEKSVPSPYLLDAKPQTVTLYANQGREVFFENHKAPTIEIIKEDAVTHNRLAGANFQVWYGSNNTSTGELNDLGTFTTDASGRVQLTGPANGLRDGWFRVKEVKAPSGYSIQADSQEAFVQAGKSHTFLFEDTPLSAIIVYKYDEKTGQALKGAEFEIKYLGGTSGTGGTSIGTFVTSDSGSFTVTGLKAGTYVITETRSSPYYSLDATPQTVYLSGADQDVVTVRFGNQPYGTVLIKKLADDANRTPLEGAVFLVTDDKGSFIGNANGEFTTGKDGTIQLPKLPSGTTVVAREIRAPEGYALDSTPQTVYVQPGEVHSLTFYNKPLCNFTLLKRDAVTKKPLKGAKFSVIDAEGKVVGRYTTGDDGTFTVTGLEPNSTIIVTEFKAPTGYVLDQTPRTVVVKSGIANSLTVDNEPTTTLVIHKYIDGTDNEPLAGVCFKVTDGSGAVVGPDGGLFYTDKSGEIAITGLEPGTTVIAREVKTADGFVLDGTPQTILIKAGQVQNLIFWNKRTGGLIVNKVDSVTKEPLAGVTFKITYADSSNVDQDGGRTSSNGIYTTDAQGQIKISGITGTVIVTEIETIPGYVIDPDSKSQTVVVNPDDTQTLTFTNDPLSGILIHKIDSATKKGIYGAVFLLYDANKNPIGQYTSDDRGYVYIDDLPSSGRYYLRELENEGYIVDTQLKTVYVRSGKTTEVTWENTPITGQIQIAKASEDYNSINGWPAGTPIPGTVFEIYHCRTGNLVDSICTDKNGVAVSSPLPLGRYKVIESQAAEFYSLDKTPIEVEIEHAGQIVKTAMTNKSLYTNVSIQKTGYVEVMSGQQIRYDFSGIANNSTVSLSSFYWRDTLPVQAVRLNRIVTGTYNATGSYKIVYKTNLSGEYRTMYDNLNTQQNYTLDASPVALGLASNEYVTEVMFSFGIVPANFRQVEAPRIDCDVVSWLTGGTQFANQADIGGVYNGQWIMVVSRWVTKVYAPAKTLPRTGY